MNKLEFKKIVTKIPKAELHIHIEAVITLDSCKKLHKKRFGKDMSSEEQASLFDYDDLNGFIQSFLKVQDYFTSEQDFDLVFDDLKNYLLDNGITYCETFFAPTAFLKKGFSYEKMIEIFHKNIVDIKEETGIVIKLLMDVSRTYGLENAMKNFELLEQFPCEDVIGIGLGGAEQKGPAKDFEKVYNLAIEKGFKVVSHAGEDLGPESIWDALNYLHSQRIGHGITAIEDEKLMQHLKEKQVPIEICITSNTFTKAYVKKASEHPLRAFFDKGLMVNINTDDPVFFKTTLLDELWICYKELNFSMDEIKTLIKNSFISSFMPQEEKSLWIEKVENFAL